ncbi:hypothetical protein LPJ78_000400 [Coemansia sp. RSA 989]|nr:hypothetical protein LPJ78_000400 [Coemansia sp. RSA 989]
MVIRARGTKAAAEELTAATHPVQVGGTFVHGGLRSTDFASQRARPSTARSRLSYGLGASSSFKEPRHPSNYNGSYVNSSGLSHVNDSRISLLSMVNTREDSSDSYAAESSHASLEPAIKNIKSTRALSNQHSTKSPEAGRPRSRTQSSEQGVVTVFSGIQEPPPLDPDLDAFNKLPKFRPLVLAPTNNRLSGLFHLGARYIEPTAERKYDLSPHVDLYNCIVRLAIVWHNFRDYLSNRVQRICDRQSEFVAAAKHMSTRAADTQVQLAHVSQQVKREQDSLAVLKSLQRQTEKSYELVQDILHDLERLEAALPVEEQPCVNENDMMAEFPNLLKMLNQRRRAFSPAHHTHPSATLRRQIAAKKAGIPAFPSRSSSVISSHSRSGSTISQCEIPISAGKPRPGPYRLPGLSRQSSTLAPSRNHSKLLSDSRSLRPRGSRSSMNSSNHSNSSIPASPITTDEARVSFDGEAIHPMENTSLAMLASHGTAKSTQRRSVQPFASLRPPVSTKSVYGDGKGSYSRSEVSLSKEQVVWSPQINANASETTFINSSDLSVPHASLAHVEEECLRCAQLVGSDSEYTDVSGRLHDMYVGPISVPSDSVEQRSRRSSRMSISAVNSGLANATISKERPHEDQSPGSNSQTSGDYAHRPIISPGSARIPQLRMPADHGTESPTSPKSLPHALSLRSASSLASSPSAMSITQSPPVGSPSIQTAGNQLSIVTASDSQPASRSAASPQFPLEATRMLRQVIMDQPDGNSDPQYPVHRSSSRSTHTDDRSSSIRAEYASSDAYSGVLEQGKDVMDIGGSSSFRRSRTSSMAASQLSGTEGSEGADFLQSMGAASTVVDGRPGSDTPRGANPWARSNPERMSTWSSSSARTLADNAYGSRISSIDDSLRASKRPPSSAALNALTVSAAMINRHPRASNLGADRKGSTIHGGARVASMRPAVDLGLSIRTDLEHRVRSYSESGRNPLLREEERPHSSMGFSEMVSGVPVWSARPDSIHARRHSPHSASLRHFRADKLNPHRLSMMSAGSQSGRLGPMSAGSVSSDEMHSDAASIGTSFSSQATDRLLLPTTSQASASGKLFSKRRAQTMNQN